MTGRARAVLTIGAILLAGSCDQDDPAATPPSSSPSTPTTVATTTDPEPVPTTSSVAGSVPTVASTEPERTVPPPIVDPAIDVIVEGLAPPVQFANTPTFEERFAGGPTRPEGAGETWDVLIGFAPPTAWLENEAVAICGWTSARAFADQCISTGVFAPGRPYRFGASSSADDRFELWLADGGAGRRLIALDPRDLGPGEFLVEFDGDEPTINEIMTTPPGPDGNYLVRR